jgi:hypothetical protein
MAKKLEEKDWKTLLGRIKDGKCTPFLGAGVNYGVLALGSEIAQKLVEKYGCPFEDSSDLARVTQVLAISRDAMFPKEEVLKLLKEQLENWQKNVEVADFLNRRISP